MSEDPFDEMTDEDKEALRLYLQSTITPEVSQRVEAGMKRYDEALATYLSAREAAYKARRLRIIIWYALAFVVLVSAFLAVMNIHV